MLPARPVRLVALLAVQCWLAILPHGTLAVVLDGPRSAEVSVGEWAEFTCQVACTHTIDWYVGDYFGDITYSCMSMDGMMVCRDIIRNCSSGSGFLERLRVLPDHTNAASSIAIQCAATAINFQPGNCPPNLVFSRFALLKVNPLPTTQPPTPPTTTPTTNPPTSSEEFLPTIVMPSPAPCPKPVTVTQVVMTTVVVTETPSLTPPATGGSHDARNHLSKILYDLLSWLLMLLLGLLTVV